MYYIIPDLLRLRDDIKFYYSTNGDIYFDSTIQDTAANEDLETAILISIMSDCKVLDTELPLQKDRMGLGGWWGDVLVGYSIGSKIWTLKDRGINENLMSALESYTQEALQWMVDDKLLSSVKPTATKSSTRQYIVATECVKADGSKLKFVYYYDQTNGIIGG